MDVLHCDECGPYLSESLKSLLEICLCVSLDCISNAGMLSQMRGLELNCGDFELNCGDLNKKR